MTPGDAQPGPARPGAREAILRAAGLIAREGGVLDLTVDRVVERAGVSKGAFFYHFASKEAMLAALLVHVADAFEAKVEAWVADGTPFHRALIAATFDEVALSAPLLAALIAAVAVDRSMARLVAARVAAWNARLEAEGMAPERVQLLRLALDGLLLSALLREEPATADELAAIGRMLEDALARDG